MGTTQIGHRPATVTGPSLHDDEVAEETPELQTAKRFVGGPRQISVQLKASEPSPWCAVIPVAKESSVAPVIEQVPANSETEIAPESPAFPSPTYAPGIESVIEPSTEPAIEQAKPEPMAAVTEETPPREPVREWEVSEPVETQASVLETEVCEPTVAEAVAPSQIEEQISTQEWSPEPEPVSAVAEKTSPREPVREWEVSEPVETQASVLETEVCEPTVAEAVAPSEIGEQISTQEWSPEPIEQGQPVPYQIVVTAEQPPETAAPEEPAIATVAEIAGVGRAIAGIGALPEATEIPTASDEEHFASQPTTIETMPETLQTPTDPVIRAGGMHTAVEITLSCEIASMQLTPAFKVGALQLRPISKVVTMRLASSPPQEAPMNLQANFEIAKIQGASGSLGQLRLNPSQQQRPATLATPSFNISSLHLVSGFESAPLQLTPSHQTQASVHLTAAFQVTSVEFSPTFEIAGIILNSTSTTVAVQLPGAGASPIENAPMFEITNVQMASNGEIALLQLNPVAKRA
jgi:hypothetical protein